MRFLSFSILMFFSLQISAVDKSRFPSSISKQENILDINDNQRFRSALYCQNSNLIKQIKSLECKQLNSLRMVEHGIITVVLSQCSFSEATREVIKIQPSAGCMVITRSNN